MTNSNSTAGNNKKFKPAGKNATPKICAAQICKGLKKKLEVIKATEKNIMPIEIQEGMVIPVYNGGYQEQSKMMTD